MREKIFDECIDEEVEQIIDDIRNTIGASMTFITFPAAEECLGDVPEEVKERLCELSINVTFLAGCHALFADNEIVSKLRYPDKDWTPLKLSDKSCIVKFMKHLLQDVEDALKSVTAILDRLSQRV